MLCKYSRKNIYVLKNFDTVNALLIALSGRYHYKSVNVLNLIEIQESVILFLPKIAK